MTPAKLFFKKCILENGFHWKTIKGTEMCFTILEFSDSQLKNEIRFIEIEAFLCILWLPQHKVIFEIFLGQSNFSPLASFESQGQNGVTHKKFYKISNALYNICNNELKRSFSKFRLEVA